MHGVVFGRNGFADGTKVTTSKVVQRWPGQDSIQSEIIHTQSGSRYQVYINNGMRL